MSEDFLMIEGGQRYTRERGLLVPLLGDRDLVVVIGKTIVGPTLEKILGSTGATIDRGELAVAVPLEIFDAAAEQRAAELAAQRQASTLYIPGIQS